eukprot:3665246-Karenia_brevis.AAC.1
MGATANPAVAGADGVAAGTAGAAAGIEEGAPDEGASGLQAAAGASGPQAAAGVRRQTQALWQQDRMLRNLDPK